MTPLIAPTAQPRTAHALVDAVTRAAGVLDQLGDDLAIISIAANRSWSATHLGVNIHVEDTLGDLGNAWRTVDAIADLFGLPPRDEDWPNYTRHGHATNVDLFVRVYGHAPEAQS
jgi:hypothetical protein